MNNLDEGSVASICSRATDMYRPQYRSEKPIAISFDRSGFAPNEYCHYLRASGAGRFLARSDLQIGVGYGIRNEY